MKNIWLGLKKRNHLPTKKNTVLNRFSSIVKRNRLSDVTEQDIERFKSERKNNGVKDSTVNRELNIIKATFNKATAWKHISFSPEKNIKKFKVSNTAFRYLSNDEIKKLLKVASGKMKTIILTYLYTGLRRTELIYLDWPDIDFKNKIISITPKEDWHPKDYEVRHIPMNKILLSALSKQSRGTTSAVFENGNKNRYLPSALSREVKQVFKKAGIKNADIKTMRHTFASHLVMNGVDLYTVQKLLGHSSVRTTERYAHLAPDYLKTAAKKLVY